MRTVQADSGRVSFESDAGGDPLQLEWSADGRRLLVATRTRITAFDPGRRAGLAGEGAERNGCRRRRDRPQRGRRGDRPRLRAGDRSELVLLGPSGSGRVPFVGSGRFDDVVYSPDGEWLLLTWRSADEWLFLNLRDPRRIVAVADIAAQFDPGTTSPPSFPAIAGWCCPTDAAGGG